MKELSQSGYAILGLLSFEPSSGYDLSAFAQHSITHFWPITRTHVYNELNRLEADGYVRATSVAQAKLPDKRIFELTEAGAEALDAWLATGDAPTEKRRNGLLLKVFFAHRMRPDQLATLLANYRERITADRDRYIGDAEMVTPDQVYMRATARYGVLRVEAELAWLDEVERLLLPPNAEGTT